MTTQKNLLTKVELAQLLNLSTRTIDRLRASGFDLGEVRMSPNSFPRFDPEKVQDAIFLGKFLKKRNR